MGSPGIATDALVLIAFRKLFVVKIKYLTTQIKVNQINKVINLSD